MWHTNIVNCGSKNKDSITLIQVQAFVVNWPVLTHAYEKTSITFLSKNPICYHFWTRGLGIKSTAPCSTHVYGCWLHPFQIRLIYAHTLQHPRKQANHQTFSYSMIVVKNASRCKLSFQVLRKAKAGGLKVKTSITKAVADTDVRVCSHLQTPWFLKHRHEQDKSNGLLVPEQYCMK